VIDLLSDQVRRDPYPVYARLREASPVLHDARSGVWMVFDYDGVKRALTDHDAFSSRAAPPGGQPLDWLIFLDPPRHTKLRALVMRAFTPRVVAGLEPRIRALSRTLLDQTIERGKMELAADFSVPLPLMVIADMIGIPAGDWPRFRRWSDAILRLSDTVSGGPDAGTAVAAYRGATAEMRDYLPALIAERRAAPHDDLLARLVDAEVDGERLSTEEILGFFQLLLVAGNETTTNLLNNAVLTLLEHPDQLARLQSAPDLLPSAIEEVLRYRSPVQAMFRAATRDVVLGEHAIPAGALVLPMIGSANRDPRQFEAPDRFDVARDPNPHVAFGHGIHFCLGAPLSRLEGRIALGDLLARARGLALASDEPWEPRKAFHVHGPVRLPVRFAPGRAS
jgi:cytochrome P450